MARLIRENVFTIVLVALLAVAMVVLRTAQTPVESLDELDELLTSGKPTLLEFYSNT